MKIKLTNILFLLGFPTLLFSQSVTDSILLPEIDIFESKEVKHSIGSRLDVINPLILNNSFSESFSDMLQSNSTVYVKSYGSLSTPSFRGTSASHTLFLWNGIPINPVAAAQSDLLLIPTSSFNNMSISYGGNSTVFGSGSVGGSIHLNNHPIYQKDRQLSLNLERGSFGNSSASVSVLQSDKFVFFTFNFSKIMDTNRFPYTYNNQEKFNEHALIEGKNISSTLALVLDRKSDMELHYWSSDFWREIAGNKTISNSTAEQTDKSKRFLFSVDRKYNNLKLKLKEALLYDNLYYDDDRINIHSYSEVETYISEFNVNYNAHNFYTDISLLHTENNLNNSSYVGLFKKEKSNSIFTSISYRNQMISTEFSLRQEYNSEIEVPLIPSVSAEVNHHKLKLRARVNKNFRAPTFNDRFWIGFSANGNPNLKAENGINKEIGLDYSSLKLSNSITFFSLKINDWILWKRQDNGNWMPENLKEVLSEGVEWKTVLNTQYIKIKIYQEYNYQYNLSTNLKGISNLDASVGKQLIYTPKHKANITTVCGYKNWSYKVNNSFVGSVFTSSDNLNELESFVLTNMSVKYNIKTIYSSFCFSIKNVFNTEYQSYQNYPNPGREFLLQLNIILK